MQRGILIVDGHRGVRAALTDRLRAAGLRPVVGARSLAEAVPFLDDPRIDGIVCDPVSLGDDIRLTVGLLTTTGKPVIVLSALPDQAALAAYAEAGVAAVLHKGRPTAVLLYALEVAVDATKSAAGESAALEVRQLRRIALLDQLGMARPASLQPKPRGQARPSKVLARAHAVLADSRHLMEHSRTLVTAAQAAIRRASEARTHGPATELGRACGHDSTGIISTAS